MSRPQEEVVSQRVGNGDVVVLPWAIHGKVLAKEYTFKDFHDGLEFVKKVAVIADKQDHHPDVLLSYGSVVLELMTHSKGRLTDKGFKLAAAIDRLS